MKGSSSESTPIGLDPKKETIYRNNKKKVLQVDKSLDYFTGFDAGRLSDSNDTFGNGITQQNWVMTNSYEAPSNRKIRDWSDERPGSIPD